ncbi:MAG: response regulator [bacterium]
MKTILVVDDEINLRKLYQQELEEEEYRVIPASNGQEAIQKFKTEDVNLVVLDIKLEQENGLDILRKMMSFNRDAKVIINTAYSTYKSDFATWSADAYLVKSSDLDELKTTISKLLADG